MIWYNKEITVKILNKMTANCLAESLEMEFVEIGPNYLKASMPVNAKTIQPFGLLHGGASAALAETVASMAAWMCVNPEKYACVGIELNCNHLKGKRDGLVFATARPFHIGGSTQVWEIKIEDETGRLICISRLTLSVVRKLKTP